MTFDPSTITTHPRQSPAEIRAVELSTVFPLAARIANSGDVGMAEWAKLDDTGRTWIAAIVRETLACAAAGNAQLYNIGERTMAQVFNAAGLVNMNDMQAVLDAVERALTDSDKIEADRNRIDSAAKHLADVAGCGKYEEAVAVLRLHQRASTSFLQRQLKVGYNEACRYVEQMQADGLVSHPDRNGGREWIDGAA